MKRLFLILLSAGLLACTQHALACTNIIVTKGASADGSCMVSYLADSHQLYGELYHWPAADWPAGSLHDIYEWDTGKYLGKIPQVAHTFQVTGNINEHQLIIGETTFGGREGLANPDGILDYGSLIYITLQRARTAREAIATLADLMDRYGWASEGETFSIADTEECWMMEIVGTGAEKGAVWVAVRIPDGEIAAHANCSRIHHFPLNDPENCLYAPDVVTFARKMGFFKGKDEDAARLRNPHLGGLPHPGRREFRRRPLPRLRGRKESRQQDAPVDQAGEESHGQNGGRRPARPL